MKSREPIRKNSFASAGQDIGEGIGRMISNLSVAAARKIEISASNRQSRGAFSVFKRLFYRGLYIKRDRQKIQSKRFKEAVRSHISERDLKYISSFSDDQSLGYCLNYHAKFALKDFDNRLGTQIFGGPGMGKTTLMYNLMENYLSKDWPVVFIDPKGDFEAMDEFRKMCGLYGRDFLIFSDAYQGVKSLKLNPLKEGNVKIVWEKLVNSLNFNQEYYRSLVENAVYHVCEKIKSQGKVITIRRLLEQLEQLAAKRSKDGFEKMFSSENLSGIISQLRAFCYSGFGDLLGSDEGLSFSEIRNTKKAIYIGLSAQGYTEMAKSLGKLIVSDLQYHSYFVQSSPREANMSAIGVFIDEFGSLANPKFIELFNKCRSAGIELVIATQTPADLDFVGDNFYFRMKESLKNVFVFRQTNSKYADMFSKDFGTKDDEKVTSQTIEGSIADRGSVRETKSFICPPDVFRKLPVGSCVCYLDKQKITSLFAVSYFPVTKRFDEYVKGIFGGTKLYVYGGVKPQSIHFCNKDMFSQVVYDATKEEKARESKRAISF